MRTIHILVILVLLALAVPAAPAHAGGVVTVCDEAHLRAALAGGGTVTFACSGTITLTNTIAIGADTTIDGSGQTVTVSGNNAVRVFTVNSGVMLNLNEVTVAGGNAGQGSGGGIFSEDGELIVSNSTFSGNSADYGGGGIYSAGTAGTLTISNTTFSGNSGGLYGGAIFNSGSTVHVSNTALFTNNATSGGGIWNSGTLTVSSASFSSNNAVYGGGMYNINNISMVTVRNSAFFGNSASGYGGGIFNGYAGRTLTVSNSTLSGNSAYLGGGGISTEGVLMLSNSTLSGNGTMFGGGGGIYNNRGGSVVVSNSTLSGDSTLYGAGGGISNVSGAVTLMNTIVAHSPAGGNCSRVITDGGGNLSFPDTTCPGINADPVLGPLQNNGGPTWTMALGEGSAAIDAADDTICAAPPVNNLDQRGVTRPQGLHCDIGAVEQIQEPSAVSVSALRAQSLPGTITPVMVAGLLLLVLVAVGSGRGPRPMG